MAILWHSDTWCSLNRANAFFHFENPLEIKQTYFWELEDLILHFVAYKWNTTQNRFAHYSVARKIPKATWTEMRDSVCHNAFFGKLKSASLNGSVILISTASLAVDWSTCRWIGLGCDSWLDIVASTSLVKLIVSHILWVEALLKNVNETLLDQYFKNYVTWKSDWK